MSRVSIVSMLVLSVLTAPAMADNPPAFLKNKYATDPESCGARPDPQNSGALTIDKNGIRGVEFSCSFLRFWSGKAGQKGTYTVLVSCADESGVTRPDMLTMTLEENGELQVQSQNEYAITEAVATATPSQDNNENATVEPYEFVTATYTMCK